MGERMATVEAQVHAIVEMREERDREIKSIKTSLSDIGGKLDLLVQDKARRDGALGLSRWLIGIGIPGMIGGWVLYLWHIFEGKS